MLPSAPPVSRGKQPARETVSRATLPGDREIPKKRAYEVWNGRARGTLRATFMGKKYRSRYLRFVRCMSPLKLLKHPRLKLGTVLWI